MENGASAMVLLIEEWWEGMVLLMVMKYGAKLMVMRYGAKVMVLFNGDGKNGNGAEAMVDLVVIEDWCWGNSNSNGNW